MLDKEESGSKPYLEGLVGQLAGNQFFIEGDRVVVGRDASQCQIVLAQSVISKVHAALEVDETQQVTLIDLTSKQSTFVNGEPITRQALRDGDRVGFGLGEVVAFTYHSASPGVEYRAVPSAADERAISRLVISTAHWLNEKCCPTKPLPKSLVSRSRRTNIEPLKLGHKQDGRRQTMKRILSLVAMSLFLCTTAGALQGGGGESTKKGSSKKAVTKKKTSGTAPANPTPPKPPTSSVPTRTSAPTKAQAADRERQYEAIRIARIAERTRVEQGIAGEWSDGTAWLTIIKEGDKFSAVYPSGKDAEVLRGELLPDNQLRLVNVTYGKLVNPLQYYEGDFDREAWIELSVDSSSLTVRFSQAKGGRSLVMKRIAGGNPASRVPAANMVIWASVSAGSSYACTVTTSGAPYCWGIGHGDITSDEVFGSPGLVEVIGDQSVAMVSAGPDSTCWLTTGGAAYCSGGNDYGQLGNGRGSTGIQHGRDSAIPTAVKGGLRFSLVSVGKNHACGLTTNGAAYCWGDNRFDQLGNIDKVWTTNDSQFIDNSYGTKSAESAVPFAVGGGLSFATLSAGAAHTCAVTTSGAAYCWGEGSHGELGNGATARSARPVAVAGGLRFASVTASNTESFTCGLTTSGAAYCWGLIGDNDNLQLGNGNTGSSSVPVAVAGGLSFTALSAGGLDVCGVTTDGAAYCWGKGGKLGTGTTKDALTPVPVAGGLKFSSISSGGSVTCGVTTSGAVYCWGNNSYGELGGATTSDRSLVPVAVRMQTDDDGFKAFFREFSAAVRKHDRAAIELMLSPKIEFPVEVRSPRMAIDYLGYQNGEGWKQLEESVTTGTKPHKDSSPQPVTRVTNDNWVLFARGSDGKWRWLRFGIPSLF